MSVSSLFAGARARFVAAVFVLLLAAGSASALSTTSTTVRGDRVPGFEAVCDGGCDSLFDLEFFILKNFP